MPVHRAFVEMFLGRGVISDKKKPAMLNVGIECDPETLADCSGRTSQNRLCGISQSGRATGSRTTHLCLKF